MCGIQGKVVVLTFFTDWNYGYGGWSQNEISGARDMIFWESNSLMEEK